MRKKHVKKGQKKANTYSYKKVLAYFFYSSKL